MDSPGPALFKQRRVGQNNNEFIMLKFRTMQVGMPDLPSDQVAEADHRFTRVGKFLRRFSLDELPQLWNVARGNMNFVGPRPALYSQYELIERRTAFGVHKIKTGDYRLGSGKWEGLDSFNYESLTRCLLFA